MIVGLIAISGFGLVLMHRRAVELMLGITLLAFSTSTLNTALALPETSELTAFRLACPAGLLLALIVYESRARAVPARVTGGVAPRTARTEQLSSLFGLGLAGTAMWALVSISWSIDVGRSLVQATAFILLTTIMVLLAKGRWRRSEYVLRDDVFCVYVVMALLLCAGFVVPGRLDPISGRFVGVFDNPNLTGLISVLCVVLGLGFSAFRFRLVLTLPLLVSVSASLIATGSRTALIAAALAISWYGLSRGGGSIAKAVWTLTLVGAVAALAGVPLPRSVDFLLERFLREGTSASLGGRTSAWSTTLDIWSERPVRGFGFRTGEELLEPLPQFNFGVSHNSYLQVLMELGLVGMFLIGLTTSVVLLAAARGGKDSLRSSLAAGAVAAFILALGESYLWGLGQVGCWFAWFLITASVAGSGDPARDQAAAQSETGRARVAPLHALAAGVRGQTQQPMAQGRARR